MAEDQPIRGEGSPEKPSWSEILGESPRHWIVGFCNMPVRRWFTFLNPEGFQHCFALAWCPDSQRWLLVQYCFNTFEVTLLTPDQMDTALLAFKTLDPTYVKCRAVKNPVLLLRGPMNCVSTVKHMLGIRAWTAIRPLGLYKWLMKNGGTPMEQA